MRIIRYTNLKNDATLGHKDIRDFIKEVQTVLNKEDIVLLELQPGDATRYEIFIIKVAPTNYIYGQHYNGWSAPVGKYAEPQDFNSAYPWTNALIAQIHNDLMNGTGEYYHWKSASPYDPDGVPVRQEK